MAKRSADELRKLAHPALRHAELVRLASENSPNKASELASGRWPRREARACRFLAILRRDFPQAFQACINPHQSTLGQQPLHKSTFEEESSE